MRQKGVPEVLWCVRAADGDKITCYSDHEGRNETKVFDVDDLETVSEEEVEALVAKG